MEELSGEEDLSPDATWDVTTCGLNARPVTGRMRLQPGLMSPNPWGGEWTLSARRTGPPPAVSTDVAVAVARDTALKAKGISFGDRHHSHLGFATN